MNRRLLFVFIFLLNLGGWVAVVEVNGFLAQYHTHLHLEILPVLFSWFFFPPLPGLILASAFGFFIGATRPLSLELTLLTFLGLWLASLWMRRHLRRESDLQIAGFAAAAQFLLLLVYSVLLRSDTAASWSIYAQRVALDALFSATAAACLAPFWCRLQLGLLAGFGWDLEHEVAHK